MKKTTVPKNPSPELGHYSSTLQPCRCFLPKGLDLRFQRTVNSPYLQDGSHEDRHPSQDENDDSGDSLLPEAISLSQDHKYVTPTGIPKTHFCNHILHPTASGRWLDPDQDLCFKPLHGFVTLFGDQQALQLSLGQCVYMLNTTDHAAALPAPCTAVTQSMQRGNKSSALHTEISNTL